jgi:uncharacterized membrane protein YfcA
MVGCCVALLRTTVPPRAHHETPIHAVKAVVKDVRSMLLTKGGLLSAILCVLPVGTGAAQVVLAQAKVAAFWGAGEHEVELMQGLASGFVTAVGCFAGGWLCQRIRPRTAYAGIGVLMAAVTTAMALCPNRVGFYVFFSLAYAFTIGLAYAAFTALVLVAMGAGSGATKYSIFASLSNFPIWWLGLVLGSLADKGGPRTMLVGEAAFGVLGVALFGLALQLVKRSRLAET